MINDDTNGIKALLDMIIASSKKTVFDADSETGHLVEGEVDDWKHKFYASRMVNSPSFSDFVACLEELEMIGRTAYGAMSVERANSLCEGIREFVASQRYYITAKMSESVYDKHNRQHTFVDVLASNKSEKIYTVNDAGKGGNLAKLLGLSRDEEQ